MLVIRDDRNGARYRDKTLEKRDRDREKERGREIWWHRGGRTLSSIKILPCRKIDTFLR